ncbi:hypothetical protein [Sedimentitalea todarodis]|uniref:Uncharacterized protein n=1 Tax=Sedimentitalea todarodis TaxID=1631240 RepID=A0ABU3V9S1_9RHOB|nr:hypothetical protein [Sedimentitalea todarodis]MDU9002833.1 hypothetical protein [Sedimentitalea todarodis]
MQLITAGDADASSVWITFTAAGTCVRPGRGRPPLEQRPQGQNLSEPGVLPDWARAAPDPLIAINDRIHFRISRAIIPIAGTPGYARVIKAIFGETAQNRNLEKRLQLGVEVSGIKHTTCHQSVSFELSQRNKSMPPNIGSSETIASRHHRAHSGIPDPAGAF